MLKIFCFVLLLNGINGMITIGYLKGSSNSKGFNLSLEIPHSFNLIAFSYLSISKDFDLFFKDTEDETLFKQIEKTVGGDRILVSIGYSDIDPSSENDTFRQQLGSIVSDQQIQQKFIQNCVKLIQNHNLAGIEIVWDHPEHSFDETKTEMVNFLKSLKSAISPHLLVIRFSPSQGPLKYYFDVKGISQTVDYIALMSFDLKSPWKDNLGPHSALYGSSNPSIDNWVGEWEANGVDLDKVVLGVPSFARTWDFIQTCSADVCDPVVTIGAAGTGFMGYTQVMTVSNGKEVQFDTETVSKSFVVDNGGVSTFISFDDTETVGRKVEYATEKGMAGVGLFYLNYDAPEYVISSVFEDDSLMPRYRVSSSKFVVQMVISAFVLLILCILMYFVRSTCLSSLFCQDFQRVSPEDPETLLSNAKLFYSIDTVSLHPQQQ